MNANRFIPGVFLLGCLCLSNRVAAQTANPHYFTHPFMQAFSRKNYDAGTQNWIILQDSRGVIYVGNGQGVLEYNGRNWRLVELDNQSTVRSMAIAGDSTIFVAGENELGYLAPDSKGELQYRSLISHISREDRDFRAVWFVHAIHEGIFFQAGNHLFRWSGDKMKVWKPPVRFNTSGVVRDTLYVHSYGEGLMRMAGDSLVLIPGSERFAEEWIFVMLPFDESTIFLGTRDQGFFLFDGKGFEPFPTEVDEFLLKYTLYLPGAVLNDGSIALGTSDAGLLIIGRRGQLLHHIDLDKGLPNESVYYVCQDHEQGLWLALNNGIARLETPSPISFINEKMGLPQSVRSLARHEGTLYAGTQRGLFTIDEKNGRVSPVKGASKTIWNMLSTDDALLATTNGGIYHIKNGKVTNWDLFKGEATGEYQAFSIHQSRLDPQVLFLGRRDGFDVIRYNAGKPGGWALLGSIPGIESEVGAIHEPAPGQLVLCTDDGVVHLTYTLNTLLTPQMIKYGADDGLPQGSALAFEAAGELFYLSGNGIYTFDPGDSQFVRRDSLFPGISFEDATAFGGLFDGSHGNIWITAKEGVYLAEPDASGGYITHAAPFLRFGDWTITTVFQEADSIVWFGGIDGLVRHDARTAKPYSAIFPPLIHQVTLGADSVLFGGPGAPVAIKNGAVPVFSYPDNTIRFDYQAPVYDMPERVRYQSMLSGFDEKWSNWTSDTWRSYTNLPRGRYTFQVRARNAYGTVSEVALYTFMVRAPLWFSWWAWTLYVLAGSLLAYGLFRWRTTEQRKKLEEANLLNERLQQVDKLKDQFLANTSHELRTPLQGIIGLSESLYEREDQPDKQEDLSMIISSGKRLNNLVNDILDFSKLKNFDIELMQKPVDVHALVGIVLKNNTPLIRGKQLELINAVPEGLPAAFADENRLQQVLYNLVGNAAKFTETGYIKVTAVEDQGLLQIGVEDTGTGIPENKREVIFQEFEQGDGSISREFAGTGLGLSISKRLVEMHGGQMWVESQVGKGSTFFFTLPASVEKVTTLITAGEASGIVERTIPLSDTAEPAPFQAFTASPVEGQGPASIRILVVDDEPINQQVLRNHLAEKGFHLTQAMNGAQAIEAIQNQPPFDLVLLDVMMPRMSGYEVCRKIREKYLSSELPVIMVTAKDQLQDVVQGLSLGANDYLRKPFHKEELLARIDTQLDLHRIFEVTGRFVPNEFLHSLNLGRLTEVALGDHAEKEVTVLFTDIRDYTSLAERMTPEQNFRFVNAFHGRMGPLIQKHQGFINQYLGDAIMAIFPGGPRNALQAAVEMQRELAEYNQERASDGFQPISMGIGLHTGSLIMGIIGDHKRMDAATISDTVNTASRIESLTKYYGTSILLSEDSFSEIENRGEFHIRYLGRVQVKGKKEPVGMYECYDGDTPASAEQKARTQADFEKALEQFFRREFSGAAASFEKVWNANQADRPALLFMNKSGEYARNGVPDDWTGVEVMSFK